MDKRKFDSLEDFIKSLRYYLDRDNLKSQLDNYSLFWSEFSDEFRLAIRSSSSYFDPTLVHDLVEYLPYPLESYLRFLDNSIILYFIYEKI